MKIWIFQTGEPVHTDISNTRAMRAINLADALIDNSHQVSIITSDFYHQQKKHRYGVITHKQVNKNLEIVFIPSPGYKKNIGLGKLYDHYILSKNLYEIVL